MNTPNTQLLHEVNQVPQLPGCYLWKNKFDEVLYVGKAKNLRARMRQYVLGEDSREKIPFMMSEVESFEYIVVSNEHEALVLEINLIQQYHPYYNVDFKDDKSYPYIAITKGDLFPAIKYTREKRKPHTRYFGPYTDSYAAKQTLEIVRKLCPICTATCSEYKRIARFLQKNDNNLEALKEELARNPRPCFDSHIGKSPGICAGCLDVEAYQKSVVQVERFLAGKRSAFVHSLVEQIHDASQNLDFEKANRYKKRLDIIQSLQDKQSVVLSASENLDVIGIWREETIAGACVIVVREGVVIRTVSFVLDKGKDVPEDELFSSFIKQYYQNSDDIGKNILLEHMISERGIICSWLSQKRSSKVNLSVPVRGKKVELLNMATQNARHTLVRYQVKTGYEDKRINEALMQLESALCLEKPPARIECYDISTIHGQHTVASMVVFSGGVADKKAYRRFKIKTHLEEANDVLSMQEVIARRFAPEKLADTRFGTLPDLVILDGGKPQLNAVAKQLDAMGVQVDLCGLAKADEELFVLWDTNPIILPNGSESLYLVKQIRDEAHRFAITYHRKLRAKALTLSILDEIPGVGPKRKKALKKHFGSFKKIKSASVQELSEVEGINHDLAQTIHSVLHSYDTTKDTDPSVKEV